MLKRRRRRKAGDLPSLEQIEDVRRQLRRQAQFRRALLSTLGVLTVAAAATVLICTLFFSVLQVSGSSMEPTLEDGDIIVLVKSNDFETGELVGLRYDGKILLKRIIGGPGDWVSIDGDGNVSVNGEVLDEPYVKEKALGNSDLTYPYQVPESSYFVLGDERAVSIDSRSRSIGCIAEDRIIGRVWICIWPFSRISKVE